MLKTSEKRGTKFTFFADQKNTKRQFMSIRDYFISFFLSLKSEWTLNENDGVGHVNEEIDFGFVSIWE